MGRDFRAALCTTAAALGADFASGRAVSAFYAQMGAAAWLGAAVSAAAFGLAMAMIAHIARRCGATRMPQLLRRMPGGPMGKCATAMYALVVSLAAVLLLGAAGHIGALALPMRRAGLLSGALAAGLALCCCVAGERACAAAGGTMIALMALYMLSLMLFGRSPAPARFAFELSPGLWNRPIAALALGLLHAAFCACISAGAAARFGGRARPARMGALCGGMFFLLLAAGCGALLRAPLQMLALEAPFVALASGWGTAGFYLSAAAAYFSAVMGLMGLFCGALPGKMMLNSKNVGGSD